MVTKYEYTKIPPDAFEKLAVNAGILVDEFDPETRKAGKQLGVSSGGIKIKLRLVHCGHGGRYRQLPQKHEGTEATGQRRSKDVRHTGHYSIKAQDVVPYEIMIVSKEAA